MTFGACCCYADCIFSRALVTQIVEAAGVFLIAAAFGVVWLPLGLFVAGLWLLVAANAPERARPPTNAGSRPSGPRERVS